jgi:hypothetical protein
MTSMAMSLSSCERRYVSQTQSFTWKGQAGKTHCQELDDPFDPSREDYTPVFSVAGIVAANVIVRWASSMSADSDVLIQALAMIKTSETGYQLTNKKRIRAFIRSSRY